MAKRNRLMPASLANDMRVFDGVWENVVSAVMAGGRVTNRTNTDHHSDEKGEKWFEGDVINKNVLAAAKLHRHSVTCQHTLSYCRK
jgi:hypothetical protein